MSCNYKIYIIQMHTNTIPSRFVRLFTRYKFSHVAISLDKSCDTTYSFGRRKVNSILDGGFVVLSKSSEFFKKFRDTNCRIYELEVSNKQYESIKHILQEMESNAKKYKYDFLGIVFRFFRIPKVFKDRYVCSYFIADLLEKAGVYKFNKESCFITPRDFEKMKNLREIYSGRYLDYNVL